VRAVDGISFALAPGAAPAASRHATNRGRRAPVPLDPGLSPWSWQWAGRRGKKRLTFVVPVAFAFTVPAQRLVGRLSAGTLVQAGLLAAFMLVASRLFWHPAIRQYAGASV